MNPVLNAFAGLAVAACATGCAATPAVGDLPTVQLGFGYSLVRRRCVIDRIATLYSNVRDPATMLAPPSAPAARPRP